MIAFIALALTLATPVAIDDVNQIKRSAPTLKDFSLVAEVVKKDDRVLSQMGKSLAVTYEFSKAKVWFKTPNYSRLEGTLGMVKTQFISTDKLFLVRVPSLRYTKREDISEKESRKRTALDFGVLTPQLFDEGEITLDKTPKALDPNIVVLILQEANPKSTKRIWVDSKDLKMLAMEKHYDGRMVARYAYSKHEKFKDGVWIPRRVELYSSEGKLAGAIELNDIKVNEGLSDSLFE